VQSLGFICLASGNLHAVQRTTGGGGAGLSDSLFRAEPFFSFRARPVD
jgi:hypothetical protein